MKVPARAMPLIIGAKGVKASEITELSGARFDLDRVKEIAILKGSPEACQKLKELIEEILAEEGLSASQAVEEEPEVRVVDSGHYKDLGPIPGAVYDAAAAAAYKARQADLNMSKSAVRRRKRKEADNGEKEEEVVEQKARNAVKSEPVKAIVIPQKKEVEKRVAQTHVEETSHEADCDDDEENEQSNYSDINIPTPDAEDEEEEEDEEVLASGISHQYSESTSPDPTLDADSYSGSQLSSGSVDRDSKHIPKCVCLDAVTPTVIIEVKAKEVPRVSPITTTQPAPVSVDTPKTVLAGGKVASSSGLLGMLLGHSNGSAPVREDKEKQEATKYSAELEKLLSSLSTSTPPSESSTKTQKASPKAVTDLENDGNKGGYYKSKSGFSVRL
jgi:KH domain